MRMISGIVALFTGNTFEKEDLEQIKQQGQAVGRQAAQAFFAGLEEALEDEAATFHKTLTCRSPNVTDIQVIDVEQDPELYVGWSMADLRQEMRWKDLDMPKGASKAILTELLRANAKMS